MDDIDNLCLELRNLAETLFGPARSDWELGDVYFAEHGPCTVYRPMEGVIDIQLSRRAENDQLQLIYQLSHEVCHTLHPSIDGESLVRAPTLVLNEGISTWFSCFICDRFGWGDIARESTYKTTYGEPMKLVAQLLEADPQAVTKLRALQPWLDRIAPGDFVKADVRVSYELAQALCETF